MSSSDEPNPNPNPSTSRAGDITPRRLDFRDDVSERLMPTTEEQHKMLIQWRMKQAWKSQEKEKNKHIPKPKKKSWHF